MKRISRRELVRKSTVAFPFLVSYGKTVRGYSPNDAIRLAFVGLRGQGRYLLRLFQKAPGMRVTALCDVDSAVLRDVVSQFNGSPKPAAYADARDAIADKNVDAVVIATPNHAHALLTIWACQAGKDVYVEKPASHNLFEGRQMVEAARKYDRIVQCGMQNRSSGALAEALDFIRSGNLGKILLTRGLCYNERKSIGKTEGPQPIPPTVDYDLWCGPAPLAPLRRAQLHYDWHWFWATGDGDIGNQGIHELDLCRWFAGQDRPPKSVVAFGGRYGYEDDAETPNTELVYIDYEPAPIVFEVRGLTRAAGAPDMDHVLGVRVGIVVECEGGYFAGGRGGGWVYDRQRKRIRQFATPGEETHTLNFLEAVRARKSELLKANVQEACLSASLFQLANLSYRLGKRAPFEEVRQSVTDRSVLAEAFRGLENHLAANQVDLGTNRIIGGPLLEVDTQSGLVKSSCRFDVGDWANRLSKPLYRPPFVVPERV